MPRDIFRTVESKYRARARVMAFRFEGLKERDHSLGVFVAVHTSNAAGTKIGPVPVAEKEYDYALKKLKNDADPRVQELIALIQDPLDELGAILAERHADEVMKSLTLPDAEPATDPV